MSHIKNNLNSGEKINHFTKPSIKPFIVFIILGIDSHKEIMDYILVDCDEEVT